MQSSKEWQGEIRKHSSAISAKKQRKTRAWERLEISSRKLEIPRKCFIKKNGHNKGQKCYGPSQAEDIKQTWQEYTKELYKKVLKDPDDNHNGVITHPE